MKQGFYAARLISAIFITVVLLYFMINTPSPKIIFILFWFGFRAVAGYISLRDNQPGMLLFSIPFWLAGFFFAKKRLFK